MKLREPFTYFVDRSLGRGPVVTLVRLNPTRGNLRAQLEELIAEYNDGARNTEQFFKDLLAFMKNKVEPEEQRSSAEALLKLNPEAAESPPGELKLNPEAVDEGHTLREQRAPLRERQQVALDPVQPLPFGPELLPSSLSTASPPSATHLIRRSTSTSTAVPAAAIRWPASRA